MQYYSGTISLLGQTKLPNSLPYLEAPKGVKALDFEYRVMCTDSNDCGTLSSNIKLNLSQSTLLLFTVSPSELPLLLFLTLYCKLYCKLPFPAHRWHTDVRGNMNTRKNKPDRWGKIWPPNPPPKKQNSKTTMSAFASLDTSCSPNHQHHASSSSPSPLLYSPSFSSSPTLSLSEPPKCFFPRFIFLRNVCSQAVGGGGGGGGVGGGCRAIEGWRGEKGKRGDGGGWNWWGRHGNPTLACPWLDYAVANYSAHMLKKNNKVGRIEMQSQASRGVWLTYEHSAAFVEKTPQFAPCRNLNATLIQNVTFILKFDECVNEENIFKKISTFSFPKFFPYIYNFGLCNVNF